MTQTIKPAPGIVFAKPIEKKTVTNSGIILPERAGQKLEAATVINSGSDKYTAGDTVVYQPFTTTEIQLDGIDYLLVSEEDILGKLVEVSGE